jgi:hypothetical protein
MELSGVQVTLIQLALSLLIVFICIRAMLRMHRGWQVLSMQSVQMKSITLLHKVTLSPGSISLYIPRTPSLMEPWLFWKSIRNFSPQSRLYFAGSVRDVWQQLPRLQTRVSLRLRQTLRLPPLRTLQASLRTLYRLRHSVQPRKPKTRYHVRFTKNHAQVWHKSGRGKSKKLVLGNLDASRDWGYAPEFVEAIWLLMQQQHREFDRILIRNCEIGTGETHTIREFVQEALNLTGLDWDVSKFPKSTNARLS